MAEGHWLDAEINPSQSQLPGLSSLKEVASLDLALIPRGDNLRSEMHARFGKPQGWKLDPWRPPVDAIKDPLISFTAVQGIASWLNRFKVVQDFGLNPTPNQLFVWGQSPKLMLQIHAALPVPDPTNTLERFRNKEVPTLNALLATNKLGTLEFSTNRPSWITWTGLPVIIPSFHPLPQSDFMTMDIFPLGRTSFTNPVPAALYHQFTSRTNLLWYDWELTGPRVTQLRPLFFLASGIFNMHPLATNSLSHQWLESAEKSLGETVTEVSITSPTELTLIRKSPVGFNGLELFSLALWLDATNFPAINTDFRIRSSLIQHKRPVPFPK
jgi:hypothetical protein